MLETVADAKVERLVECRLSQCDLSYIVLLLLSLLEVISQRS